MNGRLKLSFKGVESVSNRQLAHIILDWKIAAALSNAFFERVISDKDCGIEIAKTMLEKVNRSDDKLDRMLQKFVSDASKKTIKNLFVNIDVSDMNDFPRFTHDQIYKNITLGPYQLEQAFAYLAEHFDNNGDLEIKVCSQFEFIEQQYKTVYSKVQSRHKNRTMYDVFVVYLPNSDDFDSIRWHCVCLTGSRSCGCCSHVATIIYYLSCGRYEVQLPKPGSSYGREWLLLDKHDDVQETNEDTIVSPINIDLQDIINNQVEADNAASSVQLKRSLTTTDDLVSLSKIIEVSSTTEKQETINAFNQFVTPTQTQSQSQRVRKKSKRISSQITMNEMNVRDFTNHMPMWGGKITVISEDYGSQEDYDKHIEYSNVRFNNTCSIDYFLFALWASSKISQSFSTALNECTVDAWITSHVEKMILLIEVVEWDRARTLWILNILKRTPDEKLQISCFGNQSEFLIAMFMIFQQVLFKCETCTEEKTTQLLFDSPAEEMFCKLFVRCSKCLIMRSIDETATKFKEQPFCLFLPVQHNQQEQESTINVSQLPLVVNIDNLKFNFLCCTFTTSPNHFQSIFYLNQSFYVVDDLKKSLSNRVPDPHCITWAYYYKSS
jgi:hypothetical protein